MTGGLPTREGGGGGGGGGGHSVLRHRTQKFPDFVETVLLVRLSSTSKVVRLYIALYTVASFNILVED